MRLKQYKEPIIWLLIGSCIALAVCIFSKSQLTTMAVNDQRDIAKVVISLFGTFLGFLFALLAIIASLSSNTLIKNMIITGHYFNLILSSEILSLLLFLSIVLCLISLFYISSFLFCSIVIMVILTCIFACRTTYKFFLVIGHIKT